MNPVGGYFELELGEGGYSYHETPYTFKSGRAALHYILRICKPSLVHVPFYTCNALLQSFEAADVAYRFYAINENFEPVTVPDLANGEYFLYINYFGLQHKTVNRLSTRYASQLIVDCTQDFFTKGNGRSWFFNSCRKFFGVPDGAYLYPPGHVQVHKIEDRNDGYTVEHLIKRFKGYVQEGYAAFKENDKMCDPEIKGMSLLSQHLLSHINYQEVIGCRRANFNCLHHIFKNYNQLAVTADEAVVPMVYPLMMQGQTNRNELYSQGVYVPTFWAERIEANATGFATERRLAEKLLPLPIDHRYNESDMQRMAAVILNSR